MTSLMLFLILAINVLTPVLTPQKTNFLIVVAGFIFFCVCLFLGITLHKKEENK